MRAFYAPVNELNRCGAARGGALINEREQVCVGELLLDVGERDRFAVERVERLAREVVPEFGELRLKSASTGELADRQRRSEKSNRLRRHDLVGERILEDAVLMNPRLVREGIRANDRLVRLYRKAGEVADEPTCGSELLRLDADVVRFKLARSRAQRHHHLFQRGVASALAESVDRDLNLARPRLHGGECVRRGEAEIVVTVDAHRGVATNEIHDALGECGVLGRNGVTNGVWDVDRGGTSAHHRLVHLHQIFVIRTARIFGGELHLGVATESLARVLHPLHRLGERRFARGAQLMREMNV